MNAPMVHPGPVSPKRAEVFAVEACDVEIHLVAGQLVEQAICAAIFDAGYDGAWVDMRGLHADPFHYVMPDKSPDGTRVAWYSETYNPVGETRVDMGGMTVGHLGADNFTHCHGLWTANEGTALGHMLAPICAVSRPVRLKAVAYKGGRFDRLPDEETRFDLFRACPAKTAPKSPNAIILSLRPNVDLCTTIEDAARAHSISNGTIYGLGSINGACFKNAPPMQSAITEFIISDGVLVNGKADITLSAVDISKDIYSGTVQHGGAPISITAEILLQGN